jgi:hypothetical protein
MNEILHSLLPVLGLAILAGGFMGVQLLARRMHIRNHIDDGGCCGGCANRDRCEKNPTRPTGP